MVWYGICNTPSTFIFFWYGICNTPYVLFYLHCSSSSFLFSSLLFSSLLLFLLPLIFVFLPSLGQCGLFSSTPSFSIPSLFIVSLIATHQYSTIFYSFNPCWFIIPLISSNLFCLLLFLLTCSSCTLQLCVPLRSRCPLYKWNSMGMVRREQNRK